MSRLFFSGMIENFRKWRGNRVMVFSFSTMVLGLFGMFQFFSNGVDIDSLSSHLSQATVIYDQNGEVASKLSGSKNDGVSIKQIPKVMKHAVVAIEDHRFYDHSGIDFIGILRAFYKDVMADMQDALNSINFCFDKFLYFAVTHYTEEKNKIIDEKTKFIDSTHQDRLTLLGQMTSSFIHEFRNPLTSIQGFIQLLKSDYPQMKYLDIISNELGQLNFLC